MEIHHAHPVTGEYLGSTPARRDPKDPSRFLIPAHAYTDAPGPAPTGKVMARDGNKWVAKEKRPDAPAVTPYKRPPLSFRQLLKGLTREGWITLDEGRNWLSRNHIPMAAVRVFDATFATDGQDRFDAEADILGINEVERDHPLVAALARHAGKTEAEVDALFDTYARV